MMKIGIKTLIVMNLILGFFTVNSEVFAQDIKIATDEQVVGREKLKALMERMEMKKIVLQNEIAELKSEPHTLIKLELVGVSEEGQYWYDHNAEYEPRIFVDWETAEKFSVEDYELGDYEVGIFDVDGWELFGFDRLF